MRHDPLLATVLAALAISCNEPERTEGEGCMNVDATLTKCPDASEIALDDLYLPFNCDEEIVSKRGPGTLKSIQGQDGVARPACCYSIEKIDPDPQAQCVVGRPFKEDGQGRLAAFEVDGEARTQAWARAASGEHASVAAFARLSLQLMAHGAPVDLLEDTHRAALDEVRHTRVCLELAQHFGGTRVALPPFPFTQPVAVNVSLAELAVDAVGEGCITETVGAYAAREAALRSHDTKVRDGLLALAEDEARHAALSYRIVAWALAKGGPSVRAAVLRALAQPSAPLDTRELALRVGVAPRTLNDLQRQGLQRVVEPALQALLAA